MLPPLRPRKPAFVRRPLQPDWSASRWFLSVGGLVSLLVALIAIAALPARWKAAAEQSPTPSGSVSVVEATVGTVKDTVSLAGVVVREPNLVIKAAVDGTLTSFAMQVGSDVAAGGTLGTITEPLPPPSPTTPPPFFPPDTPTPSPSFTFVPPPASPTPVVKQVTSPIAGTVVEVDVLEGQEVSSGQVLLTLAPDQFDVIASVPARVLDRFFQPPISISVAITDGPPAFVCEFLSIGANLPTDDAQSVLRQEVDLRCRVPEGSDVFPGLRGRVDAVVAEADNVVVLPLSAIRVTDGTGTVLLMEKGHPPVRRTVTLGVSDGTFVEVVSGLVAGERVVDDIAPPHQVVSPSPSPIPGPSVSGSGANAPALTPTPSA
jgi:multidrug efflux pump subunit AcrA (membrane-fusion protein)